MPVKIVDSILAAFSYSADERNPTFVTLSDFNAVNAYPILRHSDGSYLVLQYQALAETLYETPFFWMAADKSYASAALKHRGDFAELFSEERLRRVFGEIRVFRGVRIEESKGQLLGEIDALVAFGDRAIVLQAKAKRLTIEARKGNDLQLKDDFKKAVQEAAEQAHVCANALKDGQHKLVASDGSEIRLEVRPKRIFPICIVAGHYPALSFQARQFLSATASADIAAPLVTDVFGLDAMTEMLDTPLRFISYLELRSRFGDQLLASHELTLLSYHLKRNLWVDSEYNMMTLDDDISVDLDVAMAVRREGLPGAATPVGILTKFAGTHYERIVRQIESDPNPAAMALGLLLMELSEVAINRLNAGIDQITSMFDHDGKVHDFSFAVGSSATALTVHCTSADEATARMRLEAHCISRKYITHSASWFGVLLRPDATLWAALKIEWPWDFDPLLDKETAGMRKSAAAKQKPGRNAQCPCGSGKKFKRCCLQLLN